MCQISEDEGVALVYVGSVFNLLYNTPHDLDEN